MGVEIELNTLLKEFIKRIKCDRIGVNGPEIAITGVNPHTSRVHLKYNIKEDIAQDDWQLNLYPSFKPDFCWAPHLTPGDDYIIDQHSFRSPALIMSDHEKLLILIPDLDIMSAGTPVRWYLDLNTFTNTLTLGMSNYRVDGHILYKRKPGAVYPAGVVNVGFYIMTFTDGETISDPWRPVLEFLWENWGKSLYKSGEPLKGNLEKYIEHTYKWVFDTWKESVWQEFEINGRKVGAPVFIVNVTQSPNYPGEVNEREFRSIWNQAWFSSLRSASGLYRYGKYKGRDDLIKRAQMTKEFALSAPQVNGFFPSVIATEMESVCIGGQSYSRSKGWDSYYWGNSNRNPFTRDLRQAPFHMLDMSWTTLLMLRWYEELEKDERLKTYAVTYTDALLKLQDKRGFFPAWLDKNTLRPLGILDDSPETSMSVTLLLKAYELTAKKEYLDSALRAMDVVCSDIIPGGRWEDFETYWSCCSFGRDTLVGKRVARNHMYKQCNFSMFWTAEALLCCYKLTGKQEYLTLGMRCLDEMLMTQASWQPPYMYVNTLGGFGVMNCDGEWNDSRQSLFAELIIRFGMELGKDEYIQRGLTALKCSFVMMYCPENEKTRAQWEDRWNFFGSEDYGFMMENYGHGGETGSNGIGIGEFTIYDWGNGAACEAYLRIRDHFTTFDRQEDGLNLFI